MEDGVEGLIHVSEISWSKKNVYPSRVVSVDQEVTILVLEVEEQKRRIALGLKQCLENPWEALAKRISVNSIVEGKIRNITEFGIFVQMSDEIDGMVHMSDLSWDKNPDNAIKDYAKGETIKVKVLDIDPEKERIALGVKQLIDNPFDSSVEGISKGDVLTCHVENIYPDMIEGSVTVGGKTLAVCVKKQDLSREYKECHTDRFAVGERFDAKVINISRGDRKILLSKKALEIEQEKIAMSKYGSTDSGASLGDILGAALDQAKEQVGKSEKAAADKKAAADGEADAADKKADAADGKADAADKKADAADKKVDAADKKAAADGEADAADKKAAADGEADAADKKADAADKKVDAADKKVDAADGKADAAGSEAAAADKKVDAADKKVDAADKKVDAADKKAIEEKA